MVQEQLCYNQNRNSILYPPRSVNHSAGDTDTAMLARTLSLAPGISARCQMTTFRNRIGEDMPLVWVVGDVTTPIQLGPCHALPCGWGNGRDYSMHVTPADVTRAKRVVKIVQRIDEAPINEPEPYIPLERTPLFDRATPIPHLRYPYLQYHQGFEHGSHVHFNNPFFRIYRYHGFYGSSTLYLRDIFINFPQRKVANFILALLLPATYGGIHLTALRYEFPTPIESTLWRVSCYILMAAFPAAWCGDIALKIIRPCWGWSRWYGTILVLGSVFVFFNAARIFITVESFISLRSLKVGVYWIPSWLQMFPHL